MRLRLLNSQTASTLISFYTIPRHQCSCPELQQPPHGFRAQPRRQVSRHRCPQRSVLDRLQSSFLLLFDTHIPAHAAKVGSKASTGTNYAQNGVLESAQ